MPWSSTAFPAPPGTIRNLDDPAFAELTVLAADVCGTAFAGISIVTPRSIDFYARFGHGPRRVARGADPAELCIRTGTLLEIRDARYDPNFRPDGILVNGRVFRFYAAAPLTTPEGIHIGCLFVMGPAPHSLTARQISALSTLARQVMNRLELEAVVESSTPFEDDLYRVESALSVERNFVSTQSSTPSALLSLSLTPLGASSASIAPASKSPDLPSPSCRADSSGTPSFLPTTSLPQRPSSSASESAIFPPPSRTAGSIAPGLSTASPGLLPRWSMSRISPPTSSPPASTSPSSEPPRPPSVTRKPATVSSSRTPLASSSPTPSRAPSSPSTPTARSPLARPSTR